MDSTFADVAQVVAILAALAAVWYAAQAVAETRSLRHEDRVAQVPAMIVDVAQVGKRIEINQPVTGEELWIAQQRLRAGLRAAGEPLPACERVVAAACVTEGMHPRALGINVDAVNAVLKALDEVGAVQERLRGEAAARE
jgi:hypothetical protein